jgi:hypothetical protein
MQDLFFFSHCGAGLFVQSAALSGQSVRLRRRTSGTETCMSEIALSGRIRKNVDVIVLQSVVVQQPYLREGNVQTYVDESFNRV